MQALRLLLLCCAGVTLFAAEPAPFELKPTIEGLLAPDDLDISLVAKDPLVVNPAAMCVAPDGRIFVCEDYVHARVAGMKRDVVKVLLGAENGGPATQAVTVAEDLNSVQGLAFHNGVLYIAHSPRLSTVKISADNKAGPVEDLFVGIGYDRPLKPAHGASGLFFHENKLYMVFGDQGCDFSDKEGRRMTLDTGAILRCDPDGANLEIFAHGFRNIYGTAIDPMGNVYVRDNTNDGGGYNVRNYHVVKGAYYGWPFRWREGDSATPPVDVLTKSRDMGGGSPCGQMWLHSSKWPAKYNNAVLGCEWGRAHIVFIRPIPQGATFDLPEQKLIADARSPGAKYEFRPTVAALAPDQSVLIADWGSGPLYPTEKRGRLFRVKYKGELPTQPAAPSADDIVAAMTPQTPTDDLLKYLGEGMAPVRARAAYLLGERKHAPAVEKIAALLNDTDPTVRLRAAIALGDLKDAKNLPALTAALATESERWTRQLLIRGIRMSGDAPTLAAAIKAAPPSIQKDLLYVFRDSYDEAAVTALLDFARSGSTPEVRAIAIGFLGLVARKEEKRWVWGDKPTIQPSVRNQDWAATDRIVAFLRESVRSSDAAARKAALTALQKTNDTTVIDTVLSDLKSGAMKLNDETAQILTSLIGNQKAVEPLAAYVQKNGGSPQARTEVAQLFGLWKDDVSLQALRAVAKSADSAAVRVAAIDGLAHRKDSGSIKDLTEALRSTDAEIQRAAARALGQLGAESALDDLKKAAASTDRQLKSQALTALWRVEKNGAAEAFMRGLFELPATEDSIQTEIFEAIGSSPKARLDPLLIAWLEFGAPGKGTEALILERIDKGGKLFGLSAGNKDKRATAAPKLAAYRQKNFPKFDLPANLKSAAAQPAEDEDARLERLTTSVTASKGNPAHGAEVFRNIRGANCIGCHIVNGEGRRIGPELSEVASKYTRAQLAESVLYPSKQLLDGYEQSLLTLKSGERVIGIVMNEDAEKLTVAKSDGSTLAISAADVTKKTKSKNSLMPDGLVNPISDQDFFDLISYLETLKKKGQ